MKPLAHKTAVIGGGPAGFAAAIRLAERGCHVRLFLSSPAGWGIPDLGEGMNAAMDEGDSPERHFEDTIRHGEFLANQELPRSMCDAAPALVDALDRMGVPFDRTPEGRVAFREAAGFRRTARVGRSTSSRVTAALNAQVRRFEEEGLIERFTGWEFVSAVLDGRGICRGIVAQELSTMACESFKADAVLACEADGTGAFGRFSLSTAGGACAAAALYRQGAHYANAEFVRIHPFAVSGADRARVIPWEEGSQRRLWVPRNGGPWTFLEDASPGVALTPDVVSRAVHAVIYEHNLGLDGLPAVNMDGIDADMRSILRVVPAAAQALGGLWTDDNHMTSFPGVFAAGSCAGQYHGAAVLPGNMLLSHVFGGFFAADKMANYAAGLARRCDETDEGHFLNECARQRERFQGYLDMSGPENLRRLHEELGALMIEALGSVRRNAKLAAAVNRICEFKERFERGGVADKSQWLNGEAVFARRFERMLHVAHAMALGALLRDESRGSHYKPDFPERDDEKYLKTTKARFGRDEPLLSYEDVDTRHLKPVTKAPARERIAS